MYPVLSAHQSLLLCIGSTAVSLPLPPTELIMSVRRPRPTAAVKPSWMCCKENFNILQNRKVLTSEGNRKFFDSLGLPAAGETPASHPPLSPLCRLAVLGILVMLLLICIMSTTICIHSSGNGNNSSEMWNFKAEWQNAWDCRCQLLQSVRFRFRLFVSKVRTGKSEPPLWGVTEYWA